MPRRQKINGPKAIPAHQNKKLTAELGLARPTSCAGLPRSATIRRLFPLQFGVEAELSIGSRVQIVECFCDFMCCRMSSIETTSSVHNQEKGLSLSLPRSFLQFLEENGLDPSIYAMIETIPRYIRVKPGCESQLVEIENELKCRLKKVSWLSGFYAIPSQIPIAGSKAYQQGKIYGMDAASGAAVSALNVSPGDHVLDLCCAPGAKLCMLADLLGNSGSLTGVDIARPRLAACRTMLQKYSLGDRCRLFVADGTSFSPLPVRSHMETKPCLSGKNDPEIFAEWTAKRSWRDRKKAAKAGNIADLDQIKSTPPELIFYGRYSGVVGLCKNELFCAVDEPSFSGYDRVLVDAECTHDGSLKHIQKFEDWGWETLERRVLDAKRTDSLLHLQLQLLTNGFRLLRVGGTLSYNMWKLQRSGLVEVEEFRIHYALNREHPKLVGYLLQSSQDWQVDQGLRCSHQHFCLCIEFLDGDWTCYRRVTRDMMQGNVCKSHLSSTQKQHFIKDMNLWVLWPDHNVAMND
ncbi:NOL1/NOP2/sun family [Musa troglodytarum]|uniref:NOL1/NOP2/sun family n=1 Tax=Musa troglodytarum TaxID=320322 RepID=A0A9E7HGJ6_9LILI|nr:NOL1/NOP2/sun family [Musa troglodytarum]URE29373.1 NOL1/NOP2/sun family [Musa troglodytarum]